MTPNQLKSAFTRLGHFVRTPDENLQRIVQASQNSNGWFTGAQVENALNSISKMLDEDALEQWFGMYPQLSEPPAEKKIGLILAGNIPMVGFHDILCVLACGHIALIKLSSQDKLLIPYLLEKLAEFETALNGRFQFVERLTDFDAVIATGSNNSSRYFDFYFSKVPHIIRKNRNSVALLRGDETSEELGELGNDIFSYYGLGCRNVSKLFVPEGYNFSHFFESLQHFEKIADHHKYNNNYDYNKSIYLVNRVPHLDNGFLLLKHDEAMASPLAVLYFEEYADLASVEKKLGEDAALIQCVVGRPGTSEALPLIGFGKSQEPQLWDYADGIDTMNFLLNLK